MFLKSSFDVSTWSCPVAIARLLFEQGKSKQYAPKIKELFKQPPSSDSLKPPDWDEDTWKAFKRMRVQYPELDMSCERHPLLWIRFGFCLERNGVVMSDSFLRSYSMWRERCSKELGGTMVHWETRNPREGGVSEAADCSLDYFLHAPNLALTIDSDVEVWVSHVQIRKGATKSKKTSTSEHVGSRACRLIEDRIIDAAVRGSINGLTATRDNRGRYLCHMTRNELAATLRRKYSTLAQFSELTIVRALSDFVACSWPRIT